MILPVLQVIEATRPWTGVSASSAKKTPARNSCVQQTVPIDLKEPDIKLSLKRYNRSMTIDCLPEDVLLTRMDDGDGLEQTLVSRRAKFHTACSLKFNKSEI